MRYLDVLPDGEGGWILRWRSNGVVALRSRALETKKSFLARCCVHCEAAATKERPVELVDGGFE